MNYRLHLTSGAHHDGSDERDTDELVAAIAQGGDEGLPAGWVWIAGLYVRADKVLAVEYVS